MAEVIEPISETTEPLSVESTKDSGMTPIGAIITFVVSMTGASILYVPGLFAAVSYGGVLFILAFAFMISYFSIQCLTETAIISDKFEFSMISTVCPIWVQRLAEISLFLMVFCLLGIQMIIASEMYASYIPLDKWLIILLITTITIPMGTLRSLSQLSFASNICLAAYCIFLIATIWKSIEVASLHKSLNSDVSFDSNGIDYSKLIPVFPILASALNGHVAIPSIVGELSPEKRRYSLRYLTIAMFIGAVIIFTVGAIPYALIGDQVARGGDQIPVILNILKKKITGDDSSDIVLDITRIGLGIGLTLKNGLLVVVIKYLFISMFMPGLQPTKMPFKTHFLMSLVLGSTACVFAIFAPAPILLVSLASATVGTVLQFIGPALFSFFIQARNGGVLPWDRAQNYIVDDEMAHAALDQPTSRISNNGLLDLSKNRVIADGEDDLIEPSSTAVPLIPSQKTYVVHELNRRQSLGLTDIHARLSSGLLHHSLTHPDDKSARKKASYWRNPPKILRVQLRVWSLIILGGTLGCLSVYFTIMNNFIKK